MNVMNPTTDVTGAAAPEQDSAVYGPLSGSGSSSGSGSDGDSGDLHVDASVADSKSGSNIVTGVGPVNIIIAPSTLDSETIFFIGSLVTPI
ncbi:hypothetical protein PENANT_c241G05710 [Penicillium antarcticum]|uniref:Uncharacterized protein n=1 Tax=Penicillium antarcticum TaxID=416450 RepID=A0A1V6P6A4_9EURO|nr:hypothetical protein PENANT_c241G05710 [Penicillium antarcticum]